MASELGRALIQAVQRREEPILRWGAGIALVFVALLPLAYLGMELVVSGSGVLQRALEALGMGRIWLLFLRSVGLALAVTALALLMGVPLGVLLGRTDVVGRRWVFMLHAFPMFLPPFLLALGWFYLFGRQGLVGTAGSAGILFSEFGVIAVLALTLTPIVTSLVALSLQGIDPSLEEAARVVAGPFRMVTRVSLPVTFPAMAMAALVVFAMSLSELGVPMFLRVQAYPAAVFARLGGIQYAPGEAFILVLPLLLLSLVILWGERRLVGRHSFAVLGMRREGQRMIPLQGWRLPATLVCWLVAMLSVMPIASLIIRASRGGGFGQVPAWIGSSLWNSVFSASMASTISIFLGLIIGWAIARQRPGSGLFDAMAVLAFVTPASVLGVGLIAVWNRPETLWVYGSLAIIIIGYVARYSVIGIRTIATAAAQSSPHLEEAASAFGASFLKRLVRVTLPLHAKGIAAAWLLTFVFCLRDLETAVLFYPAGLEPLPVRIFTIEANGPEAVVAALAVVHVLMVAVALGSGLAFLGRRKRG